MSPRVQPVDKGEGMSGAKAGGPGKLAIACSSQTGSRPLGHKADETSNGEIEFGVISNG